MLLFGFFFTVLSNIFSLILYQDRAIRIIDLVLILNFGIGSVIDLVLIQLLHDTC